MSSRLAAKDDITGGGSICCLLATVGENRENPLGTALRRICAEPLEEQAGFQAAVACLNRDVLAAAGLDDLSFQPPEKSWYGSANHALLRRRAVELVRAHLHGQVWCLIDDPLVSRLLPFWREVLELAGMTPAVVAVYDVAERYPEALSESLAGAVTAGDAIWLARALEVERASRGMPRSHVTLAALQTDPVAVLQRMARDLGVPALQQASIELHGPAPSATDFPADEFGQWIADFVRTVERWVVDGEDAAGHDRLDGVATAFRQIAPWLGATVTAMGQEIRRERAKVMDLAKRIAELQLRVGAAAPAPAEGVEEQLARIEARWAEIFKASRDEHEILTEQNALFCKSVDDLSSDVARLEKELAASSAEVDRLRLVELAQQAEAKAANVETSALRKSLAAAEGSVARLKDEARSREATLNALQDAVLAQSTAGARAGIGTQTSRSRGFFTRDWFQPLSSKARRKLRRHRFMRELVTASGLFDAKFYASHYPDVIAAGEDPLDHFIKFGGAEGRNPSLSFHSKWYLGENPDVRSAGLNPLVHYLEYGRDEGRRRRSVVDLESGDAAKAGAAPQDRSAAPPPAAPPAEIKPQPSDLASTWTARSQGWKRLLDFGSGRREQVVSLGQLAQTIEGRGLAIGGSLVAMLRSGEQAASAVGRAALFATWHTGSAGTVTLAGGPVPVASTYALLTAPGFGLELLADGWHDSENSLVLRFADGFAGVVRAFQFGADGALTMVAEAALAGTEADLINLRLTDQLGAILLVLSGADGALVDAVVLPFPSLLRGGLHHGELAVIESAPGSMATLADYSRTLGLEWLGWPGGPDRFAVERIEIDMRGANGTEPIFQPAVISALASRFGLSIGPVPGSAAPQRDQLVSVLHRDAAPPISARIGARGVLRLPCDTLPSLFAIVSRRLAHDPGHARIAVVDAATLKPRADLIIPQSGQALAMLQHADMPAHAPLFVPAEGGQAEDGQAGTIGSPRFPLAVRHLNGLVWQGDPLMPVSPDQPLPLGDAAANEAVAVSAIIDAGDDSEALAACLAALAQQIGAGGIEVVLAGWDDDRALPETAATIKTVAGAGLPRAARLNLAAAAASGGALLFLDPGVLLSDPRTIAFLQRIASLDGAATAACALVTEREDADEALLHSAGYFPARYALNHEPVFDVCQIDVARILPAATYPVAANHMLCCLVNGTAWHALGGFDAVRFPAAMFDLDFGVRAIAAGHANFCTTLVRAATRQAAPGADFPDAIAHNMVRPASWAQLFDRVTIIRELHR